VKLGPKIWTRFPALGVASRAGIEVSDRKREECALRRERREEDWAAGPRRESDMSLSGLE